MATRDALTRAQLDAAHCNTPGCDHKAHEGLYMHAECHPLASLSVRYQAGALYIACAICKRTVAVVAVAP